MGKMTALNIDIYADSAEVDENTFTPVPIVPQRRRLP